MTDCRNSILGLCVSLSMRDPSLTFVHNQLFGVVFKKLATIGQYIVDMFEQLNVASRKLLVLYCCNGSYCRGNDPSSKVFFHFIHGEPIDDKVVVWLKLGRDEGYVMNPEIPSNNGSHWRVVEKLG
jgi:hypothetical protein